MLGNYILHFPLTDFAVSLLAVAALVDVASRALGRASWSSAVDWLLFTGFLGTLAAIGSGLWLVAASDHPHDDTLSLHHKFAYGTLAMAVIAVAARLFQARIPALAWVRTISLVVAAFLVSGAGFVGGTMSHGSMGGHSHDGGDAHDMPTTPHHGETPVPADPGQPPTATGSDVPTSGSAAPPMTGSGAPTSGSAAGATPALPAKKPHLDDGHAH